MPIYEYVCHDCGHAFEQIQGWSDSTPSCSVCSSSNVARQLSPPAIHFKGSGWYITDSKKGQKGKNGANGVSGTNGASKDSSETSEAKQPSAESSNGDSKEKSTGSESGSQSAKSARGVYLWGGVGRGKSLLMDGFFATVPIQRKTRVHFHAFMRSVHEELKTLKNEVDPLASVAARIARRWRLVCFAGDHGVPAPRQVSLVPSPKSHTTLAT